VAWGRLVLVENNVSEIAGPERGWDIMLRWL
jgi:hypothetical protein